MKEDFTDFIEVSGLLNYDPEIISKIYRKNPKRLLKRLWQTLIPIFAYLFSVGWDKLTGRLKNEEIVAIKVQRPGLREQITLDLYIVRNIAYWLKNNIGLIRSDLVALIDELGKRVFEEMDYLNEAENAEKFRDMHKHNKMIAVPKIYKEITSRRVLAMEWIDGTKLTNLELSLIHI